jgi:hypothetical protein
VLLVFVYVAVASAALSIPAHAASSTVFGNSSSPSDRVTYAYWGGSGSGEGGTCEADEVADDVNETALGLPVADACIVPERLGLMRVGVRDLVATVRVGVLLPVEAGEGVLELEAEAVGEPVALPLGDGDARLQFNTRSDELTPLV